MATRPADPATATYISRTPNVADAIITFVQDHRKEINEMGWGEVIFDLVQYGVVDVHLNKDFKVKSRS